jgi:hypothetical protein
VKVRSYQSSEQSDVKRENSPIPSIICGLMQKSELISESAPRVVGTMIAAV